MPNHFTTIGLCSRDYDRLEALGKEDFCEIDFSELADKNLCEIVTSEPNDCDLWYEWAIDNWGTKWGTYATIVRELGGDGSPILIEFQSAWGPPNGETMRKITEYLCETYCLSKIKWIGHDPYDGSLVDVDA
jgi:hypothetical protein